MDAEALADNLEKTTRTTSSAREHKGRKDPTTTDLAPRLSLDLAPLTTIGTHPTPLETLIIALHETVIAIVEAPHLRDILRPIAPNATIALVATIVPVEIIEAIATIEIEWTTTIDTDATTTVTVEMAVIATMTTTEVAIPTRGSREVEKMIASTIATLSRWSTSLAAIFRPKSPSSRNDPTKTEPLVLLISRMYTVV